MAHIYYYTSSFFSFKSENKTMYKIPITETIPREMDNDINVLDVSMYIPNILINAYNNMPHEINVELIDQDFFLNMP